MAGEDFDIVASVDDGKARVVVSGELDIESAPRLVALVHELAVGPRRSVELDCSGVTFLDSTGVRSLIVARNEASRNGVDLVLTQPSGPVVRVMDMTGLFGLLTGTPSR
jgi:anti-anti-sigma factor